MNKKTFKWWWSFLMAMTVKEFTSRYKSAFFGFLWLFINPMIQMLVIGLVFQFFVPVKVDNYFLFLLVGLLVWNFFAYTVQKNTSIILTERSLINKANFPRETIVLSVVVSNFINLLIALVIVLGLTIFFGKFVLWSWLMSILVLLPLLLLTIGFSLLFSALNVKFRDVNFIVQAVVPLWFYATPIVYNLDLLPSYMRNWFYLNPVTSIVELYRYFTIGVSPSSFFWAEFSLLTSMFIFIIGVVVFIKSSPYFDDWI